MGSRSMKDVGGTVLAGSSPPFLEMMMSGAGALCPELYFFFPLVQARSRRIRDPHVSGVTAWEDEWLCSPRARRRVNAAMGQRRAANAQAAWR